MDGRESSPIVAFEVYKKMGMYAFYKTTRFSMPKTRFARSQKKKTEIKKPCADDSLANKPAEKDKK
jgi:hypothetical protein